MSTFAFFVFCIQACLVFNVFNSSFGAVIAPKPYAYGTGCAVPAKSYGFTEYAGPYACGTKYAAPYAYAADYCSPYTYAAEYAAPCAYGKGFAAPFAGPYVL